MDACGSHVADLAALRKKCQHDDTSRRQELCSIVEAAPTLLKGYLVEKKGDIHSMAFIYGTPYSYCRRAAF